MIFEYKLIRILIFSKIHRPFSKYKNTTQWIGPYPLSNPANSPTTLLKEKIFSSLSLSRTVFSPSLTHAQIFSPISIFTASG
jgi:hypothetical protein